MATTLVFLPGKSHGQRPGRLRTVHRVAKSQTLKWLSTHARIHCKASGIESQTQHTSNVTQQGAAAVIVAV